MKRLLPLLFSLFALIAMPFTSGCEHDGDDSFDLNLTASREELHPGETCVIRAWLIDWEENAVALDSAFHWSLSNPSLGTLSSSRGRVVTYQPVQFPDASQQEIVQTVYCKYEGVFFNNHTRQKIRHLPPR